MWQAVQLVATSMFCSISLDLKFSNPVMSDLELQIQPELVVVELHMTCGNVTSAGWQVTLFDPIWHVSSRSGVATLLTAVHLLLTFTK